MIADTAATIVPLSMLASAHTPNGIAAPAARRIGASGLQPARRRRRLLMAGERGGAVAGGKAIEAGGIGAGLAQQRLDRAAVLVVELALEEARIGQIDQRPRPALRLGEQPGEMHELLVEQLL